MKRKHEPDEPMIKKVHVVLGPNYDFERQRQRHQILPNRRHKNKPRRSRANEK